MGGVIQAGSQAESFPYCVRQTIFAFFPHGKKWSEAVPLKMPRPTRVFRDRSSLPIPSHLPFESHGLNSPAAAAVCRCTSGFWGS